MQNENTNHKQCSIWLLESTGCLTIWLISMKESVRNDNSSEKNEVY